MHMVMLETVAYGSTPRLVLVGVREGEHDLSAGGEADIPGDRLAGVVAKVDTRRV